MPPLLRTPRLLRVLAGAAVLVSALVAGVAPASAQEPDQPEQPVQLSAKPVDQPGEFFDLTLGPGQAQELAIDLGNHGTAAIAARTYAANVYSIINGGFGAGLRGTEATGTTTWLDYPTQVLDLEPGRATTRTFTVRVPPGTPAGEYITSVVLENDEPMRGEGSVALDQVVRQAVAVAVRVPGVLSPGLSIGSASHKVAAERSVVAVDVSNTGFMRLTPSADLVLHDPTGAVVSRATVPMDSFYAQSATKVEITLETALLPGNYTLDLALDDDERGAHADVLGLPFDVVAPVEDAVADPSVRSQVVDVLQPAPGQFPVWAALLATLLILFVLAAASWAVMRRRFAGRGRRRATRASSG